ncbi:MAG: 50S ribosomal protein L13, partial [Bacteroidia bacterium]|nr:50S ribosomal protein L13 [Bacteroidia bacterium]
MSKTFIPKNSLEQRKWQVVDADGAVLGRLAVQVANVLRGRNKAVYTPHLDTGDFVVVINAEKIQVTGNKEEDKSYMFYSGWRGGESHR